MAVVRRLQAVVEADGITGFESKIASAGNALGTFKKTVGLAGGALAALGAAGFAVAINEARKFEQAMVEVEKVTNPETADAMSQSIQNMAETIPLAQKELAAIAADAGRFGVEGEKAISQFTRATAKMATATDLNAQEAGEAFAKLAELTNTPISEVENLGSSINALSNNFATSAQEIVDAMLRASGAMSQFGLSQTDIAGFSAALNAVSESSERAGTRMRRLVQEISNPKKIADMARALGMNVSEYKRMQKNNPRKLLLRMIEGFKEGGQAADILNKNLSTTSRQALAGFAQNLDGLREALGMSRKEFDKNTSLQKEFRAASKTLNSQLKLLVNRIRNVALNLGSKLLPHVTNLVKGLNRAVKRFQAFNKRLDGVAAPSILAATLITGIGVAVYFLAGAITAASVVAFASGLGVVLAAVTALAAGIAALAYAWKNNMFGIRDRTMQVVAFLKGAFRSFMSFMTAIWNNNLVPLAKQTKQTFNQIKQNIRTALKFVQNNVIRPILGWMRQQWSQHGDEVMAEVRKTTKFWRTQFNKAASWIRGVLGPFMSWAGDAWGVFMDFMSSSTRGALSTIQKAWDQHGDTIMSVIKFYLDSIKGFVEFWLDGLKTLFVVVLRALRGDWEGVWDAITGFLRRTLDGLLGWLNRWGSRLRQWARGTANAAKRRILRQFNDMKDRATDAVSNMLSSMKREARGWINDFTRPFRQAKDRVVGEFNDLKDKIVGNSIVPDMLGMIQSETGDWKGSFRGEFEGAAEGAQAAMGDLPSDLSLPTPRTPARSGGNNVSNTQINLDVTVPKGVDTDTAARTIADEIKSQNFN